MIYEITLLATFVVIPLAVASWMLFARETGLISWDSSPLAGGLIMAIVFADTFRQGIQFIPFWQMAYWYLGFILQGIVVAWGSQLAIEKLWLEHPGKKTYLERLGLTTEPQ